jgi:hypothetical protein
MNHSSIVEMLNSEDNKDALLAVGILSHSNEEDRTEVKNLFTKKLIPYDCNDSHDIGKYYISTYFKPYYKKYGYDLYLSFSLTTVMTGNKLADEHLKQNMKK